MHNRAIGVLFCFCLSLGLTTAACGFDNTPTGMAVCVDGQTADCLCEDGRRGLETCSDGAYGECSCSAGDPVEGDEGTGAASGLGASQSPSANDAGAGAGQSGASGSAAGSSGADGDPGAAQGGAGGKTGNAGAGGSGGSAGAAGSNDGGSSGSAGEAGDGGGGGSSGDDANQGGRSGPGNGEPAEPGELYGFCTAQGECDDGRICNTVSNDDGTTGYCAPACSVGNGSGGGLGSCDQPDSGSVRATCAPLIGLCMLESCMGKDCPIGMECVKTVVPLPQQEQTFYDCRYPSD